MTNLTQIANSGSVYEQLISQVIAVESQPRLKLRAAQTEQTVYKGVLSDLASKVSTLDSVLGKLRDGLRSPFQARAATAPEGSGFTATASDSAAAGQHEIRVDRLARADARLSKRIDNGGTEVAALFIDPADPGEPPSGGGVLGGPRDPGRPATPARAAERTFTIRVAQPTGDPVALEVRYTPSGTGATDEEVVAGLAGAINAAAEAARADGRLAEGTGVSASVVRETSGTSRLSLRGLATGYSQRLAFDDPDGVLAALEVNREAARTGAGGGAVYAVGTGPEDSDLNAALTLDGLSIYRDTNTISDALDGVTLNLTAVSTEAKALTVGSDVKGMRSEVEAFVKAYNGLQSFLTTKSSVDPDAGTRGVFAGDAAVSSLRLGMRTDLARRSGDLDLASLGITIERNGTLAISDSAALDEALAATPDAVGALFSGTGGLGERLADRIGGLTGTSGTIAKRKQGADARIQRLGTQIARQDRLLTRREATLRDQFAQLQVISTRAQSQQNSLSSLFFF